MPFMRGSMPLRRTNKYLKQGRIFLRDNVKILTLNHHPNKPLSAGTNEFVFWHWGQLQYKNPEVQMVKYMSVTPNPWVQAFLEDGRAVVIDLETLSREEVHERICRVLAKTRIARQREDYENALTHSPAFFGNAHTRQCACEIQGQQPCPITVPVPDYIRNVWRWHKPDL